MRYSPFLKDIADIRGADLAVLRTVPEGWYVEYKSRPVRVKDFAKSLSAFANQYGGWLVIGVEETKDGTRMADAFSGIPAGDVSAVEAELRDAARDCVHPTVFYERQVIIGPAQELALPPDRAIVVVSVPPGADTPYVHCDGRIYRRVQDSSAPVPEHDRYAVDSLWRKGESARNKLRRLATQTPVVSKGEAESPFLHVFISSDPLEQAGRYHPSKFSKAVALMKDGPLAFDNIYPCSGGIIARQATGNEHTARLLTWDFYREGHSFVTVPLASFDLAARPKHLSDWLDGYEQGVRFVAALESTGVRCGRILDLNVLFFLTVGIVSLHRALLALDGVAGPFYAKAQLQNVWRCIPFLDLASFIGQISQDGVPVVQEERALCPPGDDLESFEVLPPSADKQPLSVADGLTLSLPLFSALGVSPIALAGGLGDIAFTGDRARVAQERRRRAV